MLLWWKDLPVTSLLPMGCPVGGSLCVPIKLPTEVAPINLFSRPLSNCWVGKSWSVWRELTLLCGSNGSQTRACQSAAQCSNLVSHCASWSTITSVLCTNCYRIGWQCMPEDPWSIFQLIKQIAFPEFLQLLLCFSLAGIPGKSKTATPYGLLKEISKELLSERTNFSFFFSKHDFQWKVSRKNAISDLIIFSSDSWLGGETKDGPYTEGYVQCD